MGAKKQKMVAIYRHGDVALIPVSMAKDINPQHRITKVDTDDEGRLILAYGEESGHYHATEGMNAVEASGGLILKVEKEGTIKHLGYDGPLEHTDIQIPMGEYIPVQQHEHDVTEGWRAAVD